jgi:hypothetical protein
MCALLDGTKLLRSRSLQQLVSLILLSVSCLTFSWIAFFNRAPLVFPDTIAYATAALRNEVPGMFSGFYSYLIWPLHFGISLWPVVIAQGAMLAHLVFLFGRVVSQGTIGSSALLFIAVALSLLSSLPWLSGQIMPDVFSAVLAMGLFLHCFCFDQLSRGQQVYVFSLTTIAIATHLSHVPIALGILFLCLLLRKLLHSRCDGLVRPATLMSLPVCMAISLMLVLNWSYSREARLARHSNVFLLAKLLDEGPALLHLNKACPEADYRICEFLDDLRGLTHDDLKWGWNSPFRKLGFDDLEPEARLIVLATVKEYPLVLFRNAMRDTGRQLAKFRTGEGLTPEFARLVAPHLGDTFSSEVESQILTSRQSEGRLAVSEWNRLHTLAAFLGLLSCIGSFSMARLRLPAPLVAWSILLPLAIVWNAIVTGTLAGPYDRYLARISWLLPYTGLLIMCCLCILSKPQTRLH